MIVDTFPPGKVSTIMEAGQSTGVRGGRIAVVTK
jgi:hypothetical protein